MNTLPEYYIPQKLSPFKMPAGHEILGPESGIQINFDEMIKFAEKLKYHYDRKFPPDTYKQYNYFFDLENIKYHIKSINDINRFIYPDYQYAITVQHNIDSTDTYDRSIEKMHEIVNDYKVKVKSKKLSLFSLQSVEAIQKHLIEIDRALSRALRQLKDPIPSFDELIEKYRSDTDYANASQRSDRVPGSHPLAFPYRIKNASPYPTPAKASPSRKSPTPAKASSSRSHKSPSLTRRAAEPSGKAPKKNTIANRLQKPYDKTGLSEKYMKK